MLQLKQCSLSVFPFLSLITVAFIAPPLRAVIETFLGKSADSISLSETAQGVIHSIPYTNPARGGQRIHFQLNNYSPGTPQTALVMDGLRMVDLSISLSEILVVQRSRGNNTPAVLPVTYQVASVLLLIYFLHQGRQSLTSLENRIETDAKGIETTVYSTTAPYNDRYSVATQIFTEPSGSKKAYYRFTFELTRNGCLSQKKIFRLTPKDYLNTTPDCSEQCNPFEPDEGYDRNNRRGYRKFRFQAF